MYAFRMERHYIDPDDARDLAYEDAHDERHGTEYYTADEYAVRTAAVQDEIAERYRAVLNRPGRVK